MTNDKENKLILQFYRIQNYLFLNYFFMNPLNIRSITCWGLYALLNISEIKNGDQIRTIVNLLGHREDS